jgi:hypothetical protein
MSLVLAGLGELLPGVHQREVLPAPDSGFQAAGLTGWIFIKSSLS